MKDKKEEHFDAVQMVRDIRDAMYEQQFNPNFNPNEFEQIKNKWEKCLERGEDTKQVTNTPS